MSCSPLARSSGEVCSSSTNFRIRRSSWWRRPWLAIVGHVVEHRPDAVEQPFEDPVLDGAREPPGRLVAEAHLELVAVLVEVAVESLEGRVDDLVVAALLGEAAERPTGHRHDRRRLESLPHEPLEHVVHRFVLEEVDDLDRAGEDVAGQPVGVDGLGQPVGHPIADVGGAHPLGDRVAGEEARLDELAERLAELLLALGDDRGVGDRHAERVPEQRDDGEPVGQPADQRRLGGGLHVAERGVAVGAGDHGGHEHGGDRREEHRGPSPGGDQLGPLGLQLRGRGEGSPLGRRYRSRGHGRRSTPSRTNRVMASVTRLCGSLD